jgi:hypothetical protein
MANNRGLSKLPNLVNPMDNQTSPMHDSAHSYRPGSGAGPGARQALAARVESWLTKHRAEEAGNGQADGEGRERRTWSTLAESLRPVPSASFRELFARKNAFPQYFS